MISETGKDAIAACDCFVEKHKVKYERAFDCLNKDIEKILAFYDSPVEYRSHLRTTNPIESAYATLRLRTKRTKEPDSAELTLMMVFKLLQAAPNLWRKMRGVTLPKEAVEEVKFIDGFKMAASVSFTILARISAFLLVLTGIL